MSSIRPESNPFVLFDEWYELAKHHEAKYPDGMALATASPDGRPDVRMVLLKGHDERGFVFYTNFNGTKGRQLKTNPQAAADFYWKSIDKQVRIRGCVEEVTAAEADAYYNSRPRISRLGAWASQQSEVISGREELMARLREFEARYPGDEIPRPPHWSGFRIIPNEIEFWAEGDYRLHDRRLYKRRADGGWDQEVLSP